MCPTRALNRARRVGDAEALAAADARLAEIEAEKQRLRDAPADPRIDAAETPEELKAVWPLDPPQGA
jgi:hypothetical protein